MLYCYHHLKLKFWQPVTLSQMCWLLPAVQHNAYQHWISPHEHGDPAWSSMSCIWGSFAHNLENEELQWETPVVSPVAFVRI